jgi:hypothetical protein
MAVGGVLLAGALLMALWLRRTPPLAAAAPVVPARAVVPVPVSA